MKEPLTNRNSIKQLPVNSAVLGQVVENIREELGKIENTLQYSREDIELYAHILSTIEVSNKDQKIKRQARRHLYKQYKLNLILTDLIEQLHSLQMCCKSTRSTDKPEWQEITQQFFQLEEELHIFHELHFSVKRRYLRFTHEHFQSEYRQPVMIA